MKFKKPKAEKCEMVTVSVRCDAELAVAFAALCEAEGITVSEALRQLMANQVKGGK